jgi:hypothetical protein
MVTPSERDGTRRGRLQWPRGGRLKWPHPLGLVVGGDDDVWGSGRARSEVRRTERGGRPGARLGGGHLVSLRWRVRPWRKRASAGRTTHAPVAFRHAQGARIGDTANRRTRGFRDDSPRLGAAPSSRDRARRAAPPRGRGPVLLACVAASVQFRHAPSDRELADHLLEGRQGAYA